MLVLIHGRDANEQDLFPLLDMLDPEARLLGICPQGPINSGVGFRWYQTQQVGYPEPISFWSGYRKLEQMIDQLSAEYRVDVSRSILGGFSMGAGMALSLGFGLKRPPPAGVIALSGFMPTVEDLEYDFARPTRLAVTHGTSDPVIGIEWGRRTNEVANEAGVDLLYREYDMGHAIHPSSIDGLKAWIDDTLLQ